LRPIPSAAESHGPMAPRGAGEQRRDSRRFSGRRSWNAGPAGSDPRTEPAIRNGANSKSMRFHALLEHFHDFRTHICGGLCKTNPIRRRWSIRKMKPQGGHAVQEGESKKRYALNSQLCGLRLTVKSYPMLRASAASERPACQLWSTRDSARWSVRDVKGSGRGGAVLPQSAAGRFSRRPYAPFPLVSLLTSSWVVFYIDGKGPNGVALVSRRPLSLGVR
jgi:hypothetical protein